MAYGDLWHRGCGGEIVLGQLDKYDYINDDESVSKVPEMVCKKCGREIIGDPEIEFDEGGEG